MDVRIGVKMFQESYTIVQTLKQSRKVVKGQKLDSSLFLMKYISIWSKFKCYMIV